MITQPKYYYAEKNSVWVYTDDLPVNDWLPLDTYGSILPDMVRLAGGPAPDYMTLEVRMDSHDRIGDPVTTSEVDGRRADGVQEKVPAPGFSGVGIAPFTLIRLRESTDTGKTDAVTRFMGIVLMCKINPATETYILTVAEIARWHMSRLTVRGKLYKDNVWIASDVPIFNEDIDADTRGAPNCVSSSGNPTERFVCSGKDVYWKAGNVLNYLRTIWNDPASVALYGHGETSKYLTWDPCVASGEPGETWPFLMDENAIVKNLNLNGQPLNEVLDELLAAVGPYEMRCEWNEDNNKYTLQIYNVKDGDPSIGGGLIERGKMNAEAGNNLLGGELEWSVAECATQVHGLGGHHVVEMTIAYDPTGVTGFPNALEPDWTAVEQAAYKTSEETNMAPERFINPFQRFKVKESFDWTGYLGAATQPPGPKILNGLLNSLGYDTEKRLTAKIWRWNGDTLSLELQPESVNVAILPEGIVCIGGYKEEFYSNGFPKIIATSVPPRHFRYLCSAGPSDWAVLPFAVTLSVETPETLTETVVDTPPTWPLMEEAVVVPRFDRETRHYARHLVIDGEPIESGPGLVAGVTLSTDPIATVIRSDAEELNRLAAVRLQYLSRPRLSGHLSLPVYDWFWRPGALVSNLTGGDGLPDIRVFGLIKSVTFKGLATGHQSQTLEMYNG